MARILGFHPRGPGSIPGVGDHFFFRYEIFLKISIPIIIHRSQVRFLFFTSLVLPFPLAHLVTSCSNHCIMLDEKGSLHCTFFIQSWKCIVVCIISIVALKFIYSRKATKFCKISVVDLFYIVPVKFIVDISQNFVAYSEYMNFNIFYIFFLTWL